MILYIIRHGETIENFTNVHQHSDAILSEKGREQSKILATKLGELGIEQIISSPYNRARETTMIINNALQKPVIFDDNLVEYRRPSIIRNKDESSQEIIDLKKKIEEGWQINWRHSDEETFEEFKIRIFNFIKNIKDSSKGKVLIVTHGLTIRMILSMMIFGREMSANEFKKLFHFITCENTGITTCELYPDGNWGLISSNDCTHLK